MKKSIAVLDPIRACAAWAVIAWHLSDFVGYRMPVFRSAAFAVDVFMNVSGFLMMFHYYERRSREPWESPRTWGRFMVRRFFRIAPLYYLVLMAVFWFRIVPPSAGSSIIGDGSIAGQAPNLDARFVIMHASFLFGFFPSVSADNIIPDWSLALEMQFYGAFPFLVLLMLRIGTAAFFFVCCLVSAVAGLLVSYYAGSPPGPLGWYPQPSILPLKLHVFGVGIVAASAYFNGLQELKSRWYVPSFILYSVTCTHNYSRVLGVVYWLTYFCALMPATARLVSRGLSRLNHWCETTGWFRWPAELSYSGYLIHGIVFVIVFGWPTAQTHLHSVSSVRFGITFLVMLGLICFIGVGLHRLIERPGIRTGKWFLEKSLPSGTAKHR